MRHSPPLFFTAKMESVAFHCGSDRYFRIMAGGNVFYAHRGQFEDCAALDALKPGDAIAVGCHRLDDGSHWLHWLVSTEGKRLRPIDGKQSRVAAGVAAAVGLASLALGTGLFLTRFDPVAFDFFSWLAFLSSLFGFFGVWYAWHAAAPGLAKTRTLLREGLRRAEAGDLAGFAAPPPRSAPQGTTTDWNDPALERERTVGPAENIVSNARFMRIGGTAAHYRFYTISCGGRNVSWVSLDPPFDRPLATGREMLVRERLFFLSAGDEVEATLDEEKSRGEDGRESRLALCLANRTDDGVYGMFPARREGMWRRFYRWALVLFLALSLLAPAAIALLLGSGTGSRSAETFSATAAFLVYLAAMGIAFCGIIAEFAWNRDVLFTGRPSRKRLAEAATLYALRRYLPVPSGGIPTRVEILLRLAGLLATGLVAYRFLKMTF